MNFLYPPRPEKAILPSLIPFYERRKWIAQKKLNGTCSLAFIDATGHVTFRTRHNESHKAWTPTRGATKFFENFPSTVYIFELLHSKGGGIRDTIYIFDVIRYLGRDLVGTTLQERLGVLSKIEPFDPSITVAETFTSSLDTLFRNLSDPLEEGIVLKNPMAELKSCHRDSLNADWQVKCRRPTKNYTV